MAQGRLDIVGDVQVVEELERLADVLEESAEAYKELNRTVQSEGTGAASTIKKQTQTISEQERATNRLKKEFVEVRKAKERASASKEMRATSASTKGATVAVGGLRGAFNLLGAAIKSAFLPLLAVTGIIQGLRGALRIIQDFDQSSADLAAVLGRTRAETGALTQQAQELGATTAFTASEVTALQIELAKLGFDDSEILDSTAAIQNLAIAAGGDLPRAAALAGSTIRAFGLDASDAGRVVDVIAKSFSSSALDISKFETAISTVAPVAATLGLNIEETTALIGKLVDAGFDASTAGTSLRNILLNVANGAGELGQQFEGGVSSLDELLEGFINIRESGVDLNDTLELTDKRSVAAFNQFLANAEAVGELRDQLDNAGGAAQQLADTQLDSLEGKLTLLRSAYEGFVLSIESGEGPIAFVLGGLIDIARASLEAYTVAVGAFKDAFTPLFATFRDLAEDLGLFNSETEVSINLSKLFEAAIRFGFVTPLTIALNVISLFIEGVQQVATNLGELRQLAANPIAFFAEGGFTGFDASQFKDEIDSIGTAINDTYQAFGEGIGILDEVESEIEAITSKTSELTNATEAASSSQIKSLKTLKEELQELIKVRDEEIDINDRAAIEAQNRLIAQKQAEIKALTGGTEDLKKELDKRRKLEEDFQKDVLSLIEQAEQSELGSLDIALRIDAEEQQALQGIDALQARLESQATEIIDNEAELQSTLLQIQEATDELRVKAATDAANRRAELRATETQQQIEDARAAALLEVEQARSTFQTEEAFEQFKAQRLLEIQLDYLNSQLRIAEASEGTTQQQLDTLKAQILQTQAEINASTGSNDGGSFLSRLLGIDSEEDLAEAKQILSDIGGQLAGLVSEVYEARLQENQNLINELDASIDATQARLDEELDLEKKGFANNADLERRNLEEQKARRQAALEESRKIQKQQAAIDVATQISSLATAAAKVFSAESNKGLLGIAFAITAITTMFSAFRKAKASAQEAAQLAKGGSGDSTGMVTGKRHSRGGERSTDHIEVEDGEAWGVLSRQATKRYGKTYHKMVEAMNKGKFGMMPNLEASIELNRQFGAIDTRKLEGKIDSQTQELGSRLNSLEKAFRSMPFTYQEGRYSVTKQGGVTYKVKK